MTYTSHISSLSHIKRIWGAHEKHPHLPHLHLLESELYVGRGVRHGKFEQTLWEIWMYGQSWTSQGQMEQEGPKGVDDGPDSPVLN